MLALDDAPSLLANVLLPGLSLLRRTLLLQDCHARNVSFTVHMPRWLGNTFQCVLQFGRIFGISKLAPINLDVSIPRPSSLDSNSNKRDVVM